MQKAQSCMYGIKFQLFMYKRSLLFTGKEQENRL